MTDKLQEEGLATKIGRAHRALFVDIDGVMHPRSAVAGKARLVFSSPSPIDEQIMRSYPLAFQYEPVLAALLSLHDDVVVVCCGHWRAFLTEHGLSRLFAGTRKWFAGSVGYPYRAHDFAISQWIDAHPHIEHFAIVAIHPVAHPSLRVAHLRCDPDAGLGTLRIQTDIAKWLQVTASPRSEQRCLSPDILGGACHERQ